MTTMTENPNVAETKRKGFIAFVCKNISTVMSVTFDLVRSYPDAEGENETAGIEVDREGQFSAYVHNRMNILLMWIQHVSKKDITEAKRHMQFFLHDMEHHFADPYIDQSLRNAFRWVRAFVKVYPDVSKKDRTKRAYEMIAKIYEALDINFPLQPKPELA